MKAKREPGADSKSERDYDLKGRQLHTYRDPGPAVEAPDFKPRIFGNPEEALAAAFVKLGRDFGGPLPADSVLRAVLQNGPC
jgi:hypothetical protein